MLSCHLRDRIIRYTAPNEHLCHPGDTPYLAGLSRKGVEVGADGLVTDTLDRRKLPILRPVTRCGRHLLRSSPVREAGDRFTLLFSWSLLLFSCVETMPQKTTLNGISSMTVATESHPDGIQALVGHLVHHPCDLRDIRQLMRRFQLSAESCTRALQLWEEQTLATETPRV